MHIGQLIEAKLREDGHSASWLASKICCSRTNIYKIFERNNIDVQLLYRISAALNYNFFAAISEGFSNANNSDVEKFDTFC